MVDMVGMDWDTLVIVDTMDMAEDTLHILESVRLKLIPRLLLTPTFSMVDMVDMDLDILAMLAATMDMVLDMDTLVLDTMVLDTNFMESALLMLSQKLTPTFCMEDMLDTMDMPDTMDTPMVDMPTLDKLLPLISKWTANHPCFLYE